MEYNKVIAVTGLPGLYELLSSKSDGAIVRSLDDKSTRFVSSRVHNFSHLESIEIYTVRENVNLVDVLKAMESSGEKLPDEKDAAALKGYFTKVYPDMDFDRVYTSDLKKMVKWFSVLKSNNVEIKLSELPEEEEMTSEAEPVEALAEETPKPKTSKTKAAAATAEEKPAKAKKTDTTEKETEVETEKPKAKKAAPKKKTEEKDEAEKPKKTAAKKKS